MILVIHPKDYTTDFLKIIYKDLHCVVVNENISKSLLKKHIEKSSKIIMLGHGTEEGLIGFDHLMIDSKLVYLLREKICIGIWCHADKFFKKYNLKGFYTGMFVSDYTEAQYESIITNYDEIYHSNRLFSAIMRLAIEQPIQKMYEFVKDSYYNDEPLFEFNFSGMGYSLDTSIKCVCCEKDIQIYDNGYFDDTNVGNNIWVSGIAEKISVGFGSKFDTSDLNIGLCDDCITDKLDRKIINKSL